MSIEREASEAYYNEAGEESCDKNTVLTIMIPADTGSQRYTLLKILYVECKYRDKTIHVTTSGATTIILNKEGFEAVVVDKFEKI